MIQFDASICGNLQSSPAREWLETNGLGGFASSTIVGLNTRRYHGLLIAATQPPTGRYVLLSKLEATLILNGQEYQLGCNQYPGIIYPEGFRYLQQFRMDPFPVFTYQVEGVKLEQSLFMVHGENTTVVQYKLLSSSAVSDLQLEVRPLVAFRDYHRTTHENGGLDRTLTQASGLVSIQPYQGLPALHFAHNATKLGAQSSWYRNFEYQRELERGLDHVEDLFNPFALTFELSDSRPATLIVSTLKHASTEASDLRQAEISRRRCILKNAPLSSDPLVATLVSAADQFITSRGEGKTIVAGYHWFADWGRDTMISLPGLTLVTRRPELAKNILRSFAKHVDRGMLPNRFPDVGEQPEYNTVDATLWFFEATRAYLEHTDDYSFVRQELYPVLADIITWHVRGTRYGIKAESSGLVEAGEPGVQLTWMDAKVGETVITPRQGKPVEIQALWYNALRIMQDLAQKFGDETSRQLYDRMATITNWSFNRLFWNDGDGCLYDVINGGPPDASIRPNQIFAVSLHHSMLSEDRARKVLQVVERELLTPYGLRTLSPSDSKYHGRYEGGVYERDSAYHQGTVWPWLMGPFITAYLKVNGGSRHDVRGKDVRDRDIRDEDVRDQNAREHAAKLLAPLLSYLQDAGVGQIPEVFDGDPPHRPAGCIAQAWSVAEILRVLTETIGHSRNAKQQPGAPTAVVAG